MKQLKIEYNGIVLWDGPVDEVQWSDGPNGVAVAGKIKPARPAGGIGAGIAELLTNASKAKTEAVVEEKKAALVEERLPKTDVEFVSENAE